MPDDTKDTQPTIQTLVDRFDKVEALLHEIKDVLVLLNKKFDLLSRRVIEVEASHSLLEDRVDRLEKQ
jgi:chaperonin cofactor prefoldin